MKNIHIYMKYMVVLFVILIASCGPKKEPKDQTPSTTPPAQDQVDKSKSGNEYADELSTTELYLEFVENKENQPESLLVIHNNGTKSAVNVNTKLLFHYYSEETKSIKASVDSPSFKTAIDLLPPYSKRSFKINSNLSDFYNNYPKEHVAMEFRTIYVSDADQQQYTKNTVLYLNPQGDWVYENSPSLKAGKNYQKIISSVNSYINKY